VSLAEQLFVGPAVIVDDEVERSNTEASALAAELEAAYVPVIRRTQIPPFEELVHWQKISLIILDWDLVGSLLVGAGPTENLGDEGSDGEDDVPLLGAAVPDGVRQGRDVDTLGFVRHLLKELYCPVFVVSNQDTEMIWRELEDDLDSAARDQLRARVMVRSKTKSQQSLFADLDEWITRHPAIYALKTWELGYEQAKSSLFSDFQVSSTDWPGILWDTASSDSMNPNFELTETISQNLAHRMDPHLFEEHLIRTSTPSSDKSSLRRVLHQQAVIQGSRLTPDVLLPGDFFFAENGEFVPAEIQICLSPACDLVPRSGTLAEVRMMVVTASRISDDQLTNAKQVAGKLRESDSLTSVLLSHLTPHDVPYVVKFKNWEVTTWGAIGDRRQGRLLDPYVTLLQQRFYQYMQRRGLPAMPSEFHEPRQVPFTASLDRPSHK
jgi:hypothetical protein